MNNQQVLRIDKINTLLKEIGSICRRFYTSDQDKSIEDCQANRVYSIFFVKDNKLWYKCGRCGESWEATKGSLQDRNCNGSTLNGQLESFRHFIVDGNFINIFSRYWGYDYDSLIKIHHLAKDLGITKDAYFILHDYSTNKNISYPKQSEEVKQEAMQSQARHSSQA